VDGVDGVDAVDAADAADGVDAVDAGGAMMDNVRSDGTECHAGGDSSDDYDEEVVAVTDVSDLARAYQRTAGTATNCALGSWLCLSPFLIPSPDQSIMPLQGLASMQLQFQRQLVRSRPH
jgi:hypothetical protein